MFSYYGDNTTDFFFLLLRKVNLIFIHYNPNNTKKKEMRKIELFRIGSRTAFLNPNCPTTRFLNKKISRPTTEGFNHLQAYLKASFNPLSTKRQTYVIFC
jgi:hypothetical protein